MSDPFALTEDDPSEATAAAPLPLTPARRAPSAPTRAHVIAATAKQKPFEAELLGRTGNGKVTVKMRMPGGRTTTFAVDRFRLYAVEKARGQARAKLTPAQLDALPWHGAGPDPLLQPTAAKGPPWRGSRSAASEPAGGSVRSEARTREPAPCRTDTGDTP